MLAETEVRGDLWYMSKAHRQAEQEHYCLIAGCKRTYYSSGFCKLHYQRSRPRKDGSIPTTPEIAGLAKRKTPKRFRVSGRVTEEAGARLEQSLKGRSLHDLVSDVMERYDPEQDRLIPPKDS